jgi:ABC-2 type transport system ATP-binding protein
MTLPLQSTNLGKRYGKTWALRDCSLQIAEGSVTALIGPNGAGKSTLLRLAVGLTRPSTGRITVFDRDPRSEPNAVLPRIGYVAQERPLYQRLSVDEMFKVAEHLNQRWDRPFAISRLERLGIDPHKKCGKLSGGQQAQVALVLALAKHPELIVLDEPTASLDPLARREFLQVLMEEVALNGSTVILSSHNVPDLERVCDHLVILAKSQVQIAEEVDAFLATHRVLVGAKASSDEVSRVGKVVHESSTERQTTLLVRKNGHVYDARWDVRDVGFEEIVLAYLARPAAERTEVRQGVTS